jgi:hypothetical protein
LCFHPEVEVVVMTVVEEGIGGVSKVGDETVVVAKRVVETTHSMEVDEHGDELEEETERSQVVEEGTDRLRQSQAVVVVEETAASEPLYVEQKQETS